MAAKKNTSLSDLIRNVGYKAKAIAEEAAGQGDLTLTNYAGSNVRIFNVLQYAESTTWGLGMSLYPVQKFIVKLYYHLPLDGVNKSIAIMDMFRTKVLYHLTEVEYLKYLFNEGRCNIGEQDHLRRQLILPIGRRSGGQATK